MTSSQEDHVLIDLIRNDRWEGAMVRISTQDGKEEMRRKVPYGVLLNDIFGLPLHWACLRKAPLELVEAMVEGHPEALRVTDDYGCIPLHWAACPGDEFGKGSPRVVGLLLDKYPKGAKATTKDGCLPLHDAAFDSAPLEVLTMLINAHFDGAATRSNDGELPLHRFAREGNASPDEKEDVEKMDVLIRPLLNNEEARHFAHPRSGKTPLHIGAEFDLLGLHACLRMPRCPVEVIMTVTKRRPEQLREMDEDGSLPLHLAAASPNLNGVQSGQEDLIVQMVRLYPDAAAASDGEGRSPLNLAIESGKQWKEGVEAIAGAAKGVMTIRDVGTNLFPFMLAASGANPCITTVFELLRCCPDICKKP